MTNIRRLQLLTLGYSLGLLALPAQTLLREDFNRPSGKTYTYPGPPNSGYRALANGKLDAWSSGGELTLAELEGVGAASSSGIRVTVTQPTDEFHVVTLNDISLGVTGVAIKAEDIRSLLLKFSARFPKVKSLAVALLPEGNFPDSAKWDNRLILPLAFGGGDVFKTFTFKGTEFDNDSVNKFIELVRSREEKVVKVKLQWVLNNASIWQIGDGFALDEIEIRRAP
ncbi:MAG: hypothetical protein H2172_08455 [Opitutus sp.]|nr:hypothetical protein [Opitutus sp.]MCS6246562.1 hypothetical protein [Opitutus sp.]MCS6272753.1 hypothetical protein [Opitutus sp.]MCS6276385.1 hypothetical protein [Opitutus sp.]MCS6301967.1 hypothetical protein [Opitutus sp.]